MKYMEEIMKDKILYLILGILIGAVITAGCFLIFSRNRAPQIRGERPDMSNMSEEDIERFRRERTEVFPSNPNTNTTHTTVTQ